MNTKQLKNISLAVINCRSELTHQDSKDIALSEFHMAASPDVVLALIDELMSARNSAEFYKRRTDLLQEWQSKMRDPERTIACDIIANGSTLPPEFAGNRYAIPVDTSQEKIAEQELEIKKLKAALQVANTLHQTALDACEIAADQRDQFKSRNKNLSDWIAQPLSETIAENDALRAQLNRPVGLPDWILPRITEAESRLYQLAGESDTAANQAILIRNTAAQLTTVRRTLARTCQSNSPRIEDAHHLGATGAEPTETERLLFESWMKGHCWAVIGDWNGKQYVHKHESNGFLHAGAAETRRLFAAWRDSAQLHQSIGADLDIPSENDECTKNRSTLGLKSPG